jgi:hypothetical protein
MQVGNPGSAVDVMRSASRRRNATINRLADLTDDYKIINISHTQGAENFDPCHSKPFNRVDARSCYARLL